MNEDDHVAACTVRRRPVVARQLASVKGVGPHAEPLVMESIKPVFAASVDRAPVDLFGGSVNLRKGPRPLEELLEYLEMIIHLYTS